MIGRTSIPKPANQASARATTFSGRSNADAVGSTTTSSAPLTSSRCSSIGRQPSCHSPPPNNASVPLDLLDTVMAS